MSPEQNLVVAVFGEGKTELGGATDPGSPEQGVVSILVHRLCGKPQRMAVTCEKVAFLQGKGLWQKVRFAKRKAHEHKSGAAVFVVDSEGDLKERNQQLAKGRDAGLLDFPMAIGVAHPCIESWLLTDASAIRRGLGLQVTPNVPHNPEDLAAPCEDRRNNPKTELARIAGSRKKELSGKEKDRIAWEMNDMDLPRARCPLSFAPFADEVEDRIRPLF